MSSLNKQSTPYLTPEKLSIMQQSPDVRRDSKPVMPQIRAARKHAAPISRYRSESGDDEESVRSDAGDSEDEDFDEKWEEEVEKAKRDMKKRCITTKSSLDAASASAFRTQSDQSTGPVSEADISEDEDPAPSHRTRTAPVKARSILKKATSKRRRDQDDEELESHNGSMALQKKKLCVSFVEPKLRRELSSVSNVPPEPTILRTKGLSAPLCNSIRSEASVRDDAQDNALEEVALPVRPRVSNDRSALITQAHHIQVGHIPGPSDVDPALYGPRIHASYQTRRNIVDELNKDMEPMKDVFMKLMFDKARFQDRVDQVLKRRNREWNLD
ncbi:hypothetical protein LTR50_001741 [Elasticomyces elasticus]|nr:hypothetical protein LTR50_001741 [Elasticomyces elasticus]